MRHMMGEFKQKKKDKSKSEPTLTIGIKSWWGCMSDLQGSPAGVAFAPCPGRIVRFKGPLRPIAYRYTICHLWLSGTVVSS